MASESADQTPVPGPFIGEIRAFAFGHEAAIKEMASLGWLECNGKPIDPHEYPDLANRLGRAGGFPWGSPSPGLGSFNLPDLRGAFLRGWQHDRKDGRGDPQTDKRIPSQPNGAEKNAVGSWQDSENKTHIHTPITVEGEGDLKIARAGTTGGSQRVFMDVSSAPAKTAPSGGPESRPVNAYVVYLVFAGRRVPKA